MSEVQNLVSEVSQKLKALETAQALYSRQLSPDFNTFDYINTDELGLSRILAALLNPQGSHAQQEIFLRLFIEHCLPSIHKADQWQGFLNDIEKTKVVVEQVTSKSNSRRRMDIYLECLVDNRSYGICMENKPYAADQFKQLEDYATELEKRGHKTWHIVYLNESDDGPSKRSVNEKTLNSWMVDNRYSHLRFSDLTGWLKACQIECQNHSVSEFLAQLIKFIQKQFMGIEDMSESNAVLEIMKQNSETIDASIKVANTVDQMKKDLIIKLKNDLVKECRNRGYILDFDNIGKGGNYEYFGFKIEGDDIGFICLEFATNFNTPVLGIRFHTEEDTVKPENKSYKIAIRKIFDDHFTNKKIVSNTWFSAYYEFQPFDWRTSSEAWIMINNDKMAYKIIVEVDKIYNLLNENGCFDN